jgi:hypothetical protein
MPIFEKIRIFQLVIILISAFMLGQGLVNYFSRKTGQTFLKLFVRVIVWGGLMFLGFFPDSTITVAHALGIIDNMNAVIMIGFLITFLMIFKLLSAIERLEQQLSVLTRKEALKELPNTKQE